MRYQKFKRRIFQNHAIQDDLETEVLRLKPRLDAINSLRINQEKQQKQDPMIMQYIEKEQEEINMILKELSKRFGISFIDVYARLQSEFDKNRINEQKNLAKQRLEQGQEEEDIIDLLDENNILVQRIKKNQINQEHLKPYLERRNQYLQGYSPREDLDEQKENFNNLVKALKLPSEQEEQFRRSYGEKYPKYLIQHRYQPGLMEPIQKLRYQENIERQLKEHEAQKAETEKIRKDVRNLLFGKLVNQKEKKEVAHGFGQIKKHYEDIEIAGQLAQDILTDFEDQIMQKEAKKEEDIQKMQQYRDNRLKLNTLIGLWQNLKESKNAPLMKKQISELEDQIEYLENQIIKLKQRSPQTALVLKRINKPTQKDEDLIQSPRQFGRPSLRQPEEEKIQLPSHGEEPESEHIMGSEIQVNNERENEYPATFPIKQSKLNLDPQIVDHLIKEAEIQWGKVTQTIQKDFIKQLAKHGVYQNPPINFYENREDKKDFRPKKGKNPFLKSLISYLIPYSSDPKHIAKKIEKKGK